MSSSTNRENLDMAAASPAIPEERDPGSAQAQPDSGGKPVEQLRAEPMVNNAKVSGDTFKGTVVVPPSCAGDVVLHVARILSIDEHVKIDMCYGSEQGTTFNCSMADQASLVDVLLQMPRSASWDFELVNLNGLWPDSSK